MAFLCIQIFGVRKTAEMAQKIVLTNQNNTIKLSSYFTRRELGHKSIRIQMRTINLHIQPGQTG